MQNLQDNPLVKWAATHPRITAWVVLSVGMVALLAIEARNVGLLVTQWIALIIACVLVAGLSIWIISWEDEDEDEDSLDETAPPANSTPQQSDDAKALPNA